jgi:hypothetical protein
MAPILPAARLALSSFVDLLVNANEQQACMPFRRLRAVLGVAVCDRPPRTAHKYVVCSSGCIETAQL